MIARVNAPANMENPHPQVVTKNNIPKSPYTMDGIPCNVSVVSLMTSTNLFPLFAYSTRKIAEKIPNGTAIKSDKNVIITVLISAGIRDEFRYGTPWTTTYTIRNISTANVRIAESMTRSITIREPGVLV